MCSKNSLLISSVFNQLFNLFFESTRLPSPQSVDGNEVSDSIEKRWKQKYHCIDTKYMNAYTECMYV